MTTLSVIIPAYNEEASIAAVLGRVLAVKPALREVGIDDMELVVVDDGSSDRTPELVAATAGVILLRHKRNGGYGAALKTGFAAARGELIGFLDADGTYPPEQLPALCRAALAQDADIVIGSRMDVRCWDGLCIMQDVEQGCGPERCRYPKRGKLWGNGTRHHALFGYRGGRIHRLALM